MRHASSLPASSQKKPTSKLVKSLIWLGMGILCILVLLVIAIITGCTTLGSTPSGERLTKAQHSAQWHEGEFANPQPMWIDMRGAFTQLLFGPATPAVVPDSPVSVVNSDGSLFKTPPTSGLRVTWFGHSSAQIEIDGSTVLIDPLWGERASPLTWVGPKRWYEPPIALANLPEVDAVVISHDHYDHLDQAAITAMKTWRTVFIVPLGVGAHLSGWGIPEARIIELDWWQSTQVGTLEIVATPARHASGRLTPSTNNTLWAGYAIIGNTHRVWYSGDTGFHDDLPKIGKQFGPFDVTLIEAGQYDATWPDIHLGPELAVEAHTLVGGKTMIPIHWGLIKLAEHGWTEPVERTLAAAHCRNVKVLTPRPGESIEPGLVAATPPWWPNAPWQTANQDPIIATKKGDPAERITLAPCDTTHAQQ